MQLDVFPARVRYPHGGSVSPARAIVSDGVLRVWVGSSGDPRVEYQREATSVEGSRILGYAVDTEDGVVTIVKDLGCPCGSRLKTFDPFDGATLKVESR